MAITLEQAKALSQDKLTNYVIDEFRKSVLLDKLPFDNTVKPQGGKTLAYVYNRMKTQPTAATRAINTEYTPQEADTEQVTVNLRPFGGSFQIDRVIANYEHQVVDHVQFQLAQKAKATVALFNDLVINGDSGVDANAFDGLNKALTGSSTEVTATDVTLDSAANIEANWKAFLYQLRKLRSKLDGAPSIMLMNTDMFGVFQTVMDFAGINTATKQNYGDEVAQWGSTLVMALGDKPGASKPIIETASSAGTTSIYVARLGLDGLHAVSPDGDRVVSTFLPNLKAPGAVKLGEVEMVAAVALKATRAAGVLRGVKIA